MVCAAVADVVSEDILITISIFSKRIPIGANTGKVATMTRNFLNNTNMGRLASGRKDFRVTPLVAPRGTDTRSGKWLPQAETGSGCD